MPEFPRYQSKGQLTTQTPQAPMAEDTSGKIMELGAKAGTDVQNAAIKVQDANNQIEAANLRWNQALKSTRKTIADVNQKTAIIDLQQRAEQEVDPQKQQQYVDELQKINQKNTEGLDPISTLELNYNAKVAQIQLGNTFKKKTLILDAIATQDLIDIEVNNPNPNSEANIQKILSEKVASGHMLPDVADKKYKSAQKKLKFNTFLLDFRDDPVAAEKRFNEDAYGMDVQTSEKARVKLKELKQIQYQQEGERYNDMLMRVTTGDIEDDEIEAAIELNKQNPNDGITEAHGKQIMSARYRDITKRVGAKEFNKYKKAIDFVFSASEQDRVKGYEAIVDAYSDGLDAEDAKFLNQIIKTKKDVIFANKAAAGKKFIETLFGARPKNVAEETQSLLAYARRIAEGSLPENAAQQTATDLIQKDHPATVADPDLVGAFSPKKGYKPVQKVKNESSAGR